jgi:hypothetical protein
MRKITIVVPADLPEQAQKANGTGITQTVIAGLQLIAGVGRVREVAAAPRKVEFSRTLEELKDDRS